MCTTTTTTTTSHAVCFCTAICYSPATNSTALTVWGVMILRCFCCFGTPITITLQCLWCSRLVGNVGLQVLWHGTLHCGFQKLPLGWHFLIMQTVWLLQIRCTCVRWHRLWIPPRGARYWRNSWLWPQAPLHSRQVTGARCTEVAARQSWAEYSSRPTTDSRHQGWAI